MNSDRDNKDKELLDAIYLAKTEQEVFDLLAKSF